MKQVIHIFGASGSGTSTLGKFISEKLGYRFIDSDDYLWLPTDPRFTVMRAPEDRVKLMKQDIEAAENAVISGSLSGWGNPLIPYFSLVIRLTTDTDVRLARIKQREFQRFGERILPGGDMFAQHQAFLKWAGEYDTGGINMRSKCSHDEWQKQLKCRLIELSGNDSPEKNLQIILSIINE